METRDSRPAVDVDKKKQYLKESKVEEAVAKGSNEYQLLCANCNWIKREEEGELFQWKKATPVNQ